MSKKIPTHIITGFLGSGKTTFLNHFIKQKLPERILVVENECGATNVDGALIMDGVDEVVELSAGCLCCSLSDGLLDILEMISEKREQYDRVVIETTGIADPSSILQVFLTDPRVKQVFDLEQIICLADAGFLEEWLQETEEALRQVALADVILINKIDTITPKSLPKLQKTIEAINPQAYTFTGKQGIFPIEEILKVGNTRLESVETKISSHKHEHHHNHDHEHHHNHDHEHHHNHDHEHHHNHDHEDNNSHGITTFTLSFDKPFDLEALSLELSRIVNLYRSQVYRVKGIMAVKDNPKKVILQSVRTTFVTTEGNEWKENEEKESKLVFIGKDLRKSVFQKKFNRYLVTTNQI